MINRFFIISLLLLTVNQFSAADGLAASVLQEIVRRDEPSQVQFLLRFDQLPGFTLNTHKRRVDLELADTVAGKSLTMPALDSRLIKIVSNAQKEKTVISMYFRYLPQKVVTESDKEKAILLLNVHLGNQLSAAPELAAKQGAGPGKPSRAEVNNPVNTTPYAQNWLTFFTGYESPVEIPLSPNLTLPAFPLAAALSPKITDEQWLPAEIQAQAKDRKWTQVCQLLRAEVANQPDERLKERLILTYAEALVRAGEYKEPYYLLQKILIQYPDTLMASLAHFLLVYQQAARGDHINAYYELKDLFKTIEKNSDLEPFFTMLLAELALTAARNNDAEKLLNEPTLIACQPLKERRLMRLADLLSAKKEKAKALTAYLEIAAHSDSIDTDPLALANLCDALYTAKRFPEAAKRYQMLGDLLNNAPGQDLALFRLALCQLHIPATEKKARIDLQQIQNAFPRTLGGARALLKQTDLDFAAKRLTAQEATGVYHRYAVDAPTVALREEAGFKLALVQSLSGEHEASVGQCMEQLRSFQSGKLRVEASALLIQQLPGVISRLVKNEEYVKALVLAKQNKKIFALGWLDTAMLYDLAKAYSKLGMDDQTARTYQYIFEVSGESEQERIYLPMIQSLAAAGRTIEVEEYADRYQLRYPKGIYQPAIFLLKARALYDSGQLDKAIKLLTAPGSPRQPQVELLKGRIFYDLKQWQQAIDTLAQPQLQELLAQSSLLLPLAESYFQVGESDQAAPLFRRIIEQQGAAADQAQFRMAQIEAKKNNSLQALNLFKEIAEKGKDPFWTKLAREEVAILQLQQQ